MQVTNEWARQLRENERETVLSVVVSVLESDEFQGRTVDDAASDVIERVQAIYRAIEGAVDARHG